MTPSPAPADVAALVERLRALRRNAEMKPGFWDSATISFACVAYETVPALCDALEALARERDEARKIAGDAADVVRGLVDERDRLASDNERLRAAMERVSNEYSFLTGSEMRAIARAALTLAPKEPA